VGSRKVSKIGCSILFSAILVLLRMTYYERDKFSGFIMILVHAVIPRFVLYIILRQLKRNPQTNVILRSRKEKPKGIT